MRTRFESARSTAAQHVRLENREDLALRIEQFQFRDIRPKAASEIENIHEASKLLGHSEREITEKVYRRIGETVKPTR